MIFTTLSIGEGYDSLASSFLPHLARRGYEIVVSTRNPLRYSPPICPVLCPDDGTYIWHQKRHALRAALEKSGDVVFIDGDHRMYIGYEDRIPVVFIPHPGLWSTFGSLFLCGLHLKHIGYIGQGESKKLLEKASDRFGIDYRKVRWWGDHLFAISDGGTGLGKKFVDFWDEFACWVRDDVEFKSPELVLALSDGVAMGFAAAHCGITPEDGHEFFNPIRACFQHLCGGLWRNGDFSPPEKI